MMEYTQWKKLKEVRDASMQRFLEVGLPTRIARRLAFAEFTSIEEIRQTPDKDLLEVKGFAKKSLAIVRQVLPADSKGLIEKT